MLKYRAVKKKEIDEEASRNHMNFHAVLEKASKGEKPFSILQNISPAYKWAAAACLIIVIAGASYGILFLGRTTKLSKPVVVTKKKNATTLHLETYLVPVNIACAISFDDMKIIIPAGAIAHIKESDSGQVEISGKFPLNTIDKEGFYFYIDFERGGSFDQNPLEMEIGFPGADSLTVFYGGNFKNKFIWRQLDLPAKKMIKKPTKAMLAYEQYLHQNRFLDTLAKFYKLKGSVYVKADGKGLRYEQKFIRSIKKQLKKYRSQAKFDSITLQAKNDWQLYSQQHRLHVTSGTDKEKNNRIQTRFEIREPGWYAVAF